MKRTFPAMALVIVANSLALLMAWRNRSEPRQEITLSEREFFVERESRQRSSVFLRLTTTITELSWLNEAKMAALGFSPLHSEEDSHQLARQGFVALELEGSQFHRLEEKRRRDTQSFRFSRLLPVDFALRAEELEQRYPDRSLHLIVRGTVRPSYFRNRQPPSQPGSLTVGVEKIFVPKQFRAAIPGEPGSEAYQVRLRFGKNHEPWILRVQSASP
jgi:hypothetical protein